MRESELQNPAKLLPLAGMMLAKPEEGSSESVETAKENTPGVSPEGAAATGPMGRMMYGRWQTDVYTPPPLINGKVVAVYTHIHIYTHIYIHIHMHTHSHQY